MNTKQPNIVVVVAHDLGRHLGCYGISGIESPHLDQLAHQGVRFDQAYCTFPMCSPSRAGLFTGRYPHAVGMHGLTHPPFGWDMDPDERHLAAVLKNAGYRTALVGLLHETHRPRDMGFDSIIPRRKKWAPEVAEDAEAKIAELAADSQSPFYLQVGFIETHRMKGYDAGDWGPMRPVESDEIEVPGYLKDTPEAHREMAEFYGSVRHMDQAVGRILNALDASGAADETIFLFTTDHGEAFPRAKSSLYDPGIGVSLIMRGPEALVRRGQVREELVSNIDIFPTLLELAGVDVPTNVQARSFAPLLQGERGAVREAIFAEQTYHNYADVRRCVRTRDHKLIVNFMPCAAVYDSTQQWQRVIEPAAPQRPGGAHGMLELYDLKKDPWELENLADSPDYAEIKQVLVARLSEHMQTTEDPILKGLPLPPMYHDAMRLLGGDPD
jgi:arylsulfatase A-like enzyme